MKTMDTALAEHMEGAQTNLATCWKLTRRDGVALGFTDHDQPITLDNLTFEATSGLMPTAIANTSELNVDNLDVEGMLTSMAINEADLIRGLYDFAEIEVFQIRYDTPDDGRVMLRFGWFGEVTWSGDYFVAEIRGLTQKLSQHINSAFGPTCRANLGDARCGVDMSSRTVTGEVTDVTSLSLFYDSSRTEEAGRYSHGVLHFTSGANEGVSVEVKDYQPGQITLMLPLNAPLAEGDRYELQEGCDKYLTTCTERFANAINFRGEPHIPGLDTILETSATRSEE